MRIRPAGIKLLDLVTGIEALIHDKDNHLIAFIEPILR